MIEINNSFANNQCLSGTIYIEKVCADYVSVVDGGILLMVFLNLMFLIVYPLFERNFIEKFIGKKARNIIYNIMQTFLVGFNVYIGYIYLISKNFDFVFGFKKFIMWIFIIICLGIVASLTFRHWDRISKVLEDKDEDKEEKKNENKD